MLRRLLLGLLVIFVFLLGCNGSKRTDFVTVSLYKDDHKTRISKKTIPLQQNENLLQLMTENYHVQTLYHGAVFRSIEGMQTSEKDKAGWFYTINGKDPNKAPREIQLRPGDRVEFDYHHYYSQN